MLVKKTSKVLVKETVYLRAESVCAGENYGFSNNLFSFIRLVILHIY